MTQKQLVKLSSVDSQYSPAALQIIKEAKEALGEPLQFALKSDVLFYAYCALYETRPENFEITEIQYECGDAVGAEAYDVAMQPQYKIDPYVGSVLYLKYSGDITQFSADVIQKAAAFDEIVVPDFVEKQVELPEAVLGAPHCLQFSTTEKALNHELDGYHYVTASEFERIIGVTCETMEMKRHELPAEWLKARVARYL